MVSLGPYASHCQWTHDWRRNASLCSGSEQGRWHRYAKSCNQSKLRAVRKLTRTLGFLPSFFDVAPGSPHLEELDNLLTQARQIQGEDGGLRVGVSFITGHASITSFAETALPILAKHRPAAVWLFAPEEHVKPHGKIIRAIKEMDGPAPAPRVFVQAGNVTAAREAVRDGADVVVCQGIDAGGHQFRRGMGVVSFVPEARAMLDDEFHGTEVVLLAAGGIANDKGVAAALVLGLWCCVHEGFTLAKLCV